MPIAITRSLVYNFPMSARKHLIVVVLVTLAVLFFPSGPGSRLTVASPKEHRKTVAAFAALLSLAQHRCCCTAGEGSSYTGAFA